MRIVLLLLLFNGAIFGQNSNSSPVFFSLAQVDQAPMFPGCDSPDFNECSLEKITSHFLENLDEALLGSLHPEDAVVILRFIVDREGKVRSPKVQSNNEELKIAGVDLLKELPDFIPGVHEGEKVNVIVDLPMKIENAPTVSSNSNNYDSQAMPVNCKSKKDPKLCTSEFVQQFFHKNFRDHNIKTGGERQQAVIKYTIDPEGKVTNVTAEGPNEELNKQGITTIKKLPVFIPATKDGNNVAMEFSMPIMIMTK